MSLKDQELAYINNNNNTTGSLMQRERLSTSSQRDNSLLRVKHPFETIFNTNKANIAKFSYFFNDEYQTGKQTKNNIKSVTNAIDNNNKAREYVLQNRNSFTDDDYNTYMSYFDDIDNQYNSIIDSLNNNREYFKQFDVKGKDGKVDAKKSADEYKYSNAKESDIDSDIKDLKDYIKNGFKTKWTWYGSNVDKNATSQTEKGKQRKYSNLTKEEAEEQLNYLKKKKSEANAKELAIDTDKIKNETQNTSSENVEKTYREAYEKGDTRTAGMYYQAYLSKLSDDELKLLLGSTNNSLRNKSQDAAVKYLVRDEGMTMQEALDKVAKDNDRYENEAAMIEGEIARRDNEKEVQKRIDQANMSTKKYKKILNVDNVSEYIKKGEEKASELMIISPTKMMSENIEDNNRYKELFDTDNSILDSLTEESSIYKALLGMGENKRAEEYFNSLIPLLDYRISVKTSEKAKNYGYDHPVLGTLASGATNLASMQSVGDTLMNKIQGNDIDVYSQDYNATRLTQGLRGGTENLISETKLGQTEFLGSTVGNVLYGAGTSMLDMGIAMALTGGVTGGANAVGQEVFSGVVSGIMSAEVFAPSILEAKERGLTDGQAISSAIVASAAEFLTEKFSIETLLGEPTKALPFLLKNFFAEGSEEVASDVINDIYDIFANGNNSKFKQSVVNYMNSGMSDSEAYTQAIKDMAMEMGVDFTAGALSGGVMAGGSLAINKARTNSVNRAIGNNVNSSTVQVKSLLKTAETLNDEEINKLVDKYKKSKSNKRMGELATSVYNKLLDTFESADFYDQLVDMASKFDNSNYFVQDAYNYVIDNKFMGNPHLTADTVNMTEDVTPETVEKIKNNEALKQRFESETGYKLTDDEAENLKRVTEYVNDTALKSNTGSYTAVLDDGTNISVNQFVAKNGGKLGVKTDNGVIGVGSIKFADDNVNKIAQTAFRKNYTPAMLSAVLENYNGQNVSEFINDIENIRVNTLNGSNYSNLLVLTDEQAQAIADTMTETRNKNYIQGNAKGKGQVSVKGIIPNRGEVTRFLRAFAQKTGLNVVMEDRGGNYFDTNTATIHLNGSNLTWYDGLLHEYFGEALDTYLPNMAKAVENEILKEYLDNVDGGAYSIDDKIQKYIETYRRAEGTKTYEEARTELLNDAKARLFTTEDGMKQFLDWLTDTNEVKTDEKLKIIDKFKKILDNFISLIREIGGKLNASQTDFVTDLKTQENLRKMLIETADKVNEIVKNGSDEVMPSTMMGIKNNLAVYDKHVEDLVKKYSDESDVELGDILEAYSNARDMWVEISKEIDSKFIENWNNKVYKKRPFTVFKTQSGYKYNAELSSMCAKGIPLFEAIDTIVKNASFMGKFKDSTIGKAEKEILYDVLKSHGFDIPCAICYVEQARQREGKIINEFIDGVNGKEVVSKQRRKLGWNTVIDDIQNRMKDYGVEYTFPVMSDSIMTEMYEYVPEAMDDKTAKAFERAFVDVLNEEINRMKKEGKNKPNVKGYASVNTVLKGRLHDNLNIFKVLYAEPESRMKVNKNALYSSVTTENLSSYHPKFYTLFNGQQGQAGYKTKQKAVAYVGDFLFKGVTSDKTRRAGGFRNQSNSDFQAYLLFDYIQMYADLTARGYYLQAYTKQMAEARLFGKSGAKINLSFIPRIVEYKNADGSIDITKTMSLAGLDQNGNLIYDDVEGINSAEAFHLLEDAEYSKNLCGIIIGYSDEHILKILDDSRFQMCIGFHDTTNDPNKRYRKARYAFNYNGYNEAKEVKVKSNGEISEKTVAVNFTTYIFKAENAIKKSANGTVNLKTVWRYNESTNQWEEKPGKSFGYDDIPKLASEYYREYCQKKNYKPAYVTPTNNFSNHENYYKLLADYGLYDNQGHYAPHEKVKLNLPNTVDVYDSKSKTFNTVDTKDYIKSVVSKEVGTRDKIAEELADTSENGILTDYKNRLDYYYKTGEIKPSKVDNSETESGVRNSFEVDVDKVIEDMDADEFMTSWNSNNAEKIIKSIDEQTKKPNKKRIEFIDPILDNKNFKKWFKKSKAVDRNGNPRILYHRTNADFTVFDTSKSGSNQGKTHGDGIYLSSSKTLFDYAGNKVMELYASVQNPFEMEFSNKEATYIYDKYFEHDKKGDIYGLTKEHIIKSLKSPYKVFNYLEEAAEKNNVKISDILKELGYDGVHDGAEWVVFDSTQVKSATDNVGAFDENNPDIRYSLEVETPDGNTEVRDTVLEINKKLEGKKVLKQMSVKDVDDVAVELLERHKSKLSSKSLSKKLFKLYSAYEKGSISIKQFTNQSRTIAEAIVNNTEDDKFQNYIKSFTDSLWESTRRISVDENNRNAIIKYYGSVENFEKQTGIKIDVKNGADATQVYTELAEEYGLLPELNEDMAVIHLADAIGTYNVLSAEYGITKGEAINMISAEIVNGAIQSKDVRQIIDEFYENKKQMIEGFKERADFEKKYALAEQKNNLKKSYEDKIASMALAFDERRTADKNKREQTELKHKVVREIKSLVKTLKTPTRTKYVPAQLKNSVLEILSYIDTDSMTVRQGKLGKNWNALTKAIQSIPETEMESNDVLKEFVEKAKAMTTNINLMSSKELTDMYNLIKGLNAKISGEIKGFNQIKIRNVYELATKAIEAVDIAHNQKKLTWYRKVFHNMRKLGYKSVSPHVVFNMLDGYSGAMEELMDMLTEGEAKMTRIRLDGLAMFDDLVKEKDGYKSLKDDVEISTIKYNGKNLVMTRGMMLELYMNLLNDDNRRHLASSGFTIPNKSQYYKAKFDDAYSNGSRTVGKGLEFAEIEKRISEALENGEDTKELKLEKREIFDRGLHELDKLKEEIESKLTDYDKKFIKTAKEYFAWSADIINKATLERFGYEKANIEDYYPITVNRNFIHGLTFDSFKTDATLENAGILKDRTVSGAPLLIGDIVGTIDSHNKKVGQIGGLMNAIGIFNEVYYAQFKGATKSLANSIDKIPGAKKYIDNLMEDIVGGKKSENVLMNLRSMLASSSLTLSLRVAGSQAASYIVASPLVGKRNLALAVKNVGDSIKGKDLELIYKYSPWLKDRMQGSRYAGVDYSVSLGDNIDGRWGVTKALDTAIDKAHLDWIQSVDAKTVNTLWYACEYKVRQDNPNLYEDMKSGEQEDIDDYYNEVAKLFNRVVTETQPQYSMAERPELLRNEYTKTFMMFYTQRLQNLSMMTDAVARYVNAKGGEEKKKARKNLASTISSQIISTIALVMMKYGVDKLLRDDEKYGDNPEDIRKSLMVQFGETFFGNVPFASELESIVTYMIKRAEGEYVNWYSIESGELSVLNGFIEGMGSLAYDLSKGKDETYIMRDAQKIAQITGLPVRNVYKLVNAMYEWVTKGIS